jgi:hypothetical protein
MNPHAEPLFDRASSSRPVLKAIFTLASIAVSAIGLGGTIRGAEETRSAPRPRDYRFDGAMSRKVLENYLSRSISMEGLLNGRGDLDDNIRMLHDTGAKFIGRSLCLWGRESELIRNLERAKQQIPKVHAVDPEMILQACIFEIVTSQVNQVPVPEWAFVALGQPVEKRNFRYADMLYPDGKRVNHWGRNGSVPDVSRPETKLWFYFLAAAFIDLGIEAIHFGQTELMNGNDRNLDHYSQILALIRAHAKGHARRHMLVCDSHVPSGGLVRQGQLLMDFHSFPLRIMEVPERPQEAILKVGFSDGIYNRSKGGKTYSDWACEHLPYLVEIDNYGASSTPGQAKAGGIWVWGYDEITWFAHQSREYRKDWLRYAWDWVRRTDPNGHLQMPGSRTMRSPRDQMRWYFANNPSPAVPTGLGDEEAIRAIWADDSEGPTATATAASTAADADISPTFTGEKTAWHDGFDRFDFVMNDEDLSITPFKRQEDERFGVKAPAKGQRRCIVVVPKNPAPGKPWSWQGCYWDHEPQTEVELLRRGFHIAFITPDPGKQWDAWYTYLTEKHGLSKKPAFIGMSRGGVTEYDWTTVNPEKASCIYADNPAIRPDALAKLGELAKNDVPLLNICGSADFLLEKHTLAIENRYHQLGGRITVMIKEGAAHHPHSLRNPKPIADWIVEHVQAPAANRPDFIDGTFVKTYFYGLENSYNELKEEKTFVTCRGPGFTECYDRYDAVTRSPWGIRGMSVIVPKTPAAGKPWVFRADRITRDSMVDRALLAKGFHIVVAPLLAQSGAVREQWDAVYKLMTEHGFSKKPVMHGTGSAAGEAYAWAIENPDKVGTVYGENPVLRSLMSKKPPLENLASLAKAGVPLIHVCGSLDPWLETQTRVVEKRYKELGGQITVIINEGAGHYPLSPKDPHAVVDLIIGRAN